MDATQTTMIVGAISSILAFLGVVANMVNTYFREQRARRWAIEDKLELAAHTEAKANEVKAVAESNFADIKKTGEARLTTIMAGQDEIAKKVDENTQVSVDAFKEANGVNAKLLNLGVTLAGTPSKVVIVNPEPIEVHQTEKQTP